MTGPGTTLRGTVADGTGPLADGDGAELRSSFLQLAERFRPHQARHLNVRWLIDITDCPSFTLHVNNDRCFVSAGARGRPDATLRTDLSTWRDLVSGRRDGIRAFCDGALEVTGDLNLAVRFETLFRPGSETTRFLKHTRTDACGTTIEAIVAGRGTPVLLLHGLAASKVSFLPTLDGLADRYEVHALDLPGFGGSDRPLPTGSRYSMKWLAHRVRDYLRATGIRHAYVVGNSMGGRVACELALRSPRRVRGVVALGPAVAFDEYQWLAPILRLVHGHWAGVAPLPVPSGTVRNIILDCFHDPSRIPAANIDAAVAEFLKDATDRRYRLAVLACARHIASERSSGRNSFWRRIARLRAPSYWVWGDTDRLSPPRYADKVREHLRDARVEVWPDMGHVPQFEDPDLTNERIGGFLDGLESRHA